MYILPAKLARQALTENPDRSVIVGDSKRRNDIDARFTKWSGYARARRRSLPVQGGPLPAHAKSSAGTATDKVDFASQPMNRGVHAVSGMPPARAAGKSF